MRKQLIFGPAVAVCFACFSTHCSLTLSRISFFFSFPNYLFSLFGHLFLKGKVPCSVLNLFLGWSRKRVCDCSSPTTRKKKGTKKEKRTEECSIITSTRFKIMTVALFKFWWGRSCLVRSLHRFFYWFFCLGERFHKRVGSGLFWCCILSLFFFNPSVGSSLLHWLLLFLSPQISSASEFYLS